MLQSILDDALALGEGSGVPTDPLVDAIRLRLLMHARELRHDPAPDPALCPQVMDDLFACGLFALTVPRAFGGLEASLHDFTRCIEAVGEMGAAYAMTAVPHLCISVESVARLCEPGAARDILGRIGTAKRLVAFAITEGNGSDVAAMSTRLQRLSDGTLRLSGRKQWITNLSRAEHVVVVARCPDLHPMPGATVLVCVGTQQRGVTIGAHWHKHCANGSDTADIYFDDVEIEPGQLMGVPGKGLTLFHDMVQPGRLGAAAACVGLARGALNAAMADPQAALDEGHARQMSAAVDVLSGTVALTARLGDAGHPEFPSLAALAKHGASSEAQRLIGGIDLAYARRGRSSPGAVVRAVRAVGLLRLLKGPGEVIALQAVASWLARHEETGANPEWPRALRIATGALGRDFSELSQRGGASADPARMLGLAALCAAGWALAATFVIPHDSAARRWAFQRFHQWERDTHDDECPDSHQIALAHVALNAARANGRLTPTEPGDAPWIDPSASGGHSSSSPALLQ